MHGTQSWREIFASLRWHFAGLTAVWVVIALLKLGHTSEPPPIIAVQNTRSLDQLVRAFQENRQQFLEFLETPAEKAPARPQPAVVPRRSERLSKSMSFLA
ncbi:MAG: hypothetical protein HY735_17225 [Verrucomicrobia bacterium]|nr:hypothetical protein [Verrucomicrobiota bacterium]